jgi:branched-chain amino acid transport system substrate-binding protein
LPRARSATRRGSGHRPSNTAQGIPQIGEYVSRVSAPVNQIAPHAVKAAMDINPNLKRVAVLFAQNDAFSKSETQVFQQTVKDNPKLELVTTQTFQTTDTDFTAQTTNVLAAKPDLVIISGLAADGGNLVKQLRELGYKGLIVGGNGFNTTNLFPVCKALCDGILVAQAYSYQASSEINQAFRRSTRKSRRRSRPSSAASPLRRSRSSSRPSARWTRRRRSRAWTWRSSAPS